MRPPTAAIEAEQAILGALMLDPGCWGDVDNLLPEDFAREAHRQLYRLLARLREQGKAADLLVVSQAVSTDPGTYGGIAYVSGLPEHVPSTQGVPRYVREVREAGVRRRMLHVARQLQEAAQGEVDLTAALARGEKALQDLAGSAASSGWVQLHELVERQYQAAGERAELRERHIRPGLPTGWGDLDRLMGGLLRDDLVILAARPAMGKTAMAINLARQVAGRGVGVGVFELEMSGEQLTDRLFAGEAAIDAADIRDGVVRGRREMWARLADAAETLSPLPIWVDPQPGATIAQVASRARRLKALHPEVGLIVVDYLQLMQGMGGKGERREQAISSISRGLKVLAKELGVPVLALSQLNRGCEERPDKRPQLSDLRESGAIEQDADRAIFLYRDEVYNPDSADAGICEVLIRKNRHGGTGTIRLAWSGAYQRFTSLAAGNREEA